MESRRQAGQRQGGGHSWTVRQHQRQFSQALTDPRLGQVKSCTPGCPRGGHTQTHKGVEAVRTRPLTASDMDATNAPARTFNYPGEHRFVNGLWQVGERTPRIQKAVPGTSSRHGMARHTRSRWHAHLPLLGTRRLLIPCGRAKGVLGCFPHMNVSMPSAHTTRGQQRGGKEVEHEASQSRAPGTYSRCAHCHCICTHKVGPAQWRTTARRRWCRTWQSEPHPRAAQTPAGGQGTGGGRVSNHYSQLYLRQHIATHVP